MALLFAVTAVAGFAPNSVAIIIGARPTPPLLTHIHAALMTTWLLLLICQTQLIRKGNRELHQRLGLVTLFLAPSMLLVMVGLVISTFDADYHPYSVGLIQLRRLILFPAFWAAAMYLRQSSPDAHKRLQLWATLVLLDAAIMRMPWLPNLGSENLAAVSGSYMLVFAGLMIAYDLYTEGRILKANVVPSILVASTSLAASVLW